MIEEYDLFIETSYFCFVFVTFQLGDVVSFGVSISIREVSRLECMFHPIQRPEEVQSSKFRTFYFQPKISILKLRSLNQTILSSSA